MIYEILFVCYMLINISSCGKAPVLMWGAKSSDLKPSLSVIPSADFRDLMEKQLEECMLVVFVEKELSIQDLSRCKIDSDSLCYTNLTQYTPKTYYTNVEDPLDSLKEISDKKEYIEADDNGDLSDPVVFEPGKVVFINFQNNPNESRKAMLHNHDSIIVKAYQRISKLGKIVALYTSSRTNIYSREIRQISPAASESNKGYFYENLENKFLIYFTSLKKISSPDADINIRKATLQETESKNYDIKLTDDNANDITFQIKFAEGYWTLEDLKWNNKSMRVNPAISVPEGFSYYCGGPTKYTTDKDELAWSSLQIQAFIKPKADPAFGDAWHCVGFTSPGIWGGLFVSFMLLGILSIGITWLMDIKTMDRFDDPKGKTITINTSE